MYEFYISQVKLVNYQIKRIIVDIEYSETKI